MNYLKKYIFLVFLLTFIGAIETKVLIFTYAYNRPDFIEIQHKTLQEFLEDEYEFVVFSDASNDSMHQDIKRACDTCGIECVRIPQHIHNQPYLQRWPGEDYNHPTVRNVNAVMYSLNMRGFKHDDILVLLDSDIFLVKKFNIRKQMEQYDMIGYRIDYHEYPYIWHGLTFFNMKTLPEIDTINFNCGRINGLPVDGGAYSHFYLKAHPKIKVHYFDIQYSLDFRCEHCFRKAPVCTHVRQKLLDAGFDEDQAVYFEQSDNSQFMYGKRFLHYRSGTNWEHHNQHYINQKTHALHAYLNVVINKNKE